MRKNSTYKRFAGLLLSGKLWITAMVFLVAACSSIDCPLNSKVYTKYKLAGEVKKIDGKLTAIIDLGDENDSTWFNQITAVDSFEIPMSYQREEDKIHLIYTDTVTTYHDTIVIKKTNTPHFEAVDCSPAFFHHVENISYTRNCIDSIVINNPNVNYDASKSTFYIYFKSIKY